ncbi:MAG: C40 family peptidase [Elusimicrobia bacterium]|nr:C40 family peptidase [Elusimicrobiota bacterium]
MVQAMLAAALLGLPPRASAALKLPDITNITVSFEGTNGMAGMAVADEVRDALPGDAVFPAYYVQQDGLDLYSKKPRPGKNPASLRVTQLYRNEPVRQLAFTKDGWSLVEVDRLTQYNEKTGAWESAKGWVRTDSLGGDSSAGARWQESRVWYGPGPGGGPVPEASPMGTPEPPRAEPPKGLLDAFIQSLLSFRGTPYKWGGTSPGRDGGVDCSGLIVASLTRIGFGRIPRTAADQQRATGAQPLTDPRALKPGDLVFVGRRAHHVLAYLGGGKVIEAPKRGDVVSVSSLRERFGSLANLSYGTILP